MTKGTLDGEVLKNSRLSVWLQGILLVCCLVTPVAGQVRLGGVTLQDLSGEIGLGYGRSSSSSDSTASASDVEVNGHVSGSGYYYHPEFLHYGFLGVYGRTDDSAGAGAQNIAATKSLAFNAGIFSGSAFPIAVDYVKAFDNSQTYGLVGTQGLASQGASQSFSLTLSERVKNWIPVNIGYSTSSSTQNVYGVSGNSQSSSQALSVYSPIWIAGWLVLARYNYNEATTSPISGLTGESEPSHPGNDRQSFSASTARTFKKAGNVSFSFSHDIYGSSGTPNPDSGSNTDLTASYSAMPLRQLASNTQVQYNSNFASSLNVQLLNSGANPLLAAQSSGESLNISNSETYPIWKSLTAAVSFGHSQEFYGGGTYSSNRFNGVISDRFQRSLLGQLTVYVGANDSASQQTNQGGGLVAGATFGRTFRGWEVGSGFSYAQEVQTAFAVTTTSNMTYSASVMHRLTRHLRMNAYYVGFHSGFEQAVGQQNLSNMFSTMLSYRRYSLSGGFTENRGLSLVTATGIVNSPITVLPSGVGSTSDQMQTTGKSFNIGGSASPLRRLTISVNYSNGTSSSTSSAQSVATVSKVLTGTVQYQVRKFSLNSSFVSLTQGGQQGTSVMSPTRTTSFSVGVARWFSFF